MKRCKRTVTNYETGSSARLTENIKYFGSVLSYAALDIKMSMLFSVQILVRHADCLLLSSVMHRIIYFFLFNRHTLCTLVRQLITAYSFTIRSTA